MVMHGMRQAPDFADRTILLRQEREKTPP